MANLKKSSLNEDMARKFAIAAQIEIKRENLKRWIEAENAAQVYIDDDKADPTLVARQMGKPMAPRDLEAKLKPLLGPNYLFEYLPDPNKPLDRPRMKQITKVLPNGTKERVLLYHNDVMPEHSIMSRRTEDVPDMTANKLDRKDFPKAEWNGKEFVWDKTTLKPGYKRVTKPARELFRGYRTILLRLVLEGHLGLPSVENAFGSDNRREWAAKAHGRSEFATPW